MNTAILVPPGTWWTSYTDGDGHRAVLTVAADGGLVTLTTPSGESLLFSTLELATLREDLESAATAGKPSALTASG